MLIDTHAHLYLEHFKEDFEDILQRMSDAEVQKVFLPNIDVDSIDANLNLMNSYPGMFYSMLGLHPCSVNADWKDQLEIIKQTIDKYESDIYAIGEIGLDTYWDKTYIKEQEEALRIQVEWAKMLDLPIVIHCRETIDRTTEILSEASYESVRGIFHCFTGTLEQARRIIDLGYLLGIGGVATFKNGGLEPVLRDIDLKYMVLETDAPYLAPTPFRGKRNESSYVTLVAQRVAEVKETNLDQVIEQTTENARMVFGLGIENDGY